MFTGIITAIGEVRAITPIGATTDMRLTLHAPWPDTSTIAIGASIACAGCCLTATHVGADEFSVEASAETLSKTTLGSWRIGTKVNLERALKVGDELGGHIVSGHVDGIAEVLSVNPEHGSTSWRFALPAPLARFVAQKGSVALDGVSLTVNKVGNTDFAVNLIAHTHAATTFGERRPGDRVNLEIDTVARYVARLQETAPLSARP